MKCSGCWFQISSTPFPSADVFLLKLKVSVFGLSQLEQLRATAMLLILYWDTCKTIENEIKMKHVDRIIILSYIIRVFPCVLVCMLGYRDVLPPGCAV